MAMNQPYNTRCSATRGENGWWQLVTVCLEALARYNNKPLILVFIFANYGEWGLRNHDFSLPSFFLKKITMPNYFMTIWD